MVHDHEPIYVFRLTQDMALRWATLSILIFFASVAGVSGFYQAIHGRRWTLVSASYQTNQLPALLIFFGFIAVNCLESFFYICFAVSNSICKHIEKMFCLCIFSTPGRNFISYSSEEIIYDKLSNFFISSFS